jgi:hypothetical protein
MGGDVESLEEQDGSELATRHLPHDRSPERRQPGATRGRDEETAEQGRVAELGFVSPFEVDEQVGEPRGGRRAGIHR